MIKTTGLAILLVIATFVFGSVSGRVYAEHVNALFTPERLLDLALWVLLAIGFAMIAAALVAALVKPMWACALVFAASALSLILGAGVSLATLSYGVVFFGAGLLYAHQVMKGLDKRLDFSVEPIQHSQGVLVLALVIVTGVSLYRGFALDMERGGYVLPPVYKRFATGLIEPILRAQIETQPLKPEERTRALDQARTEIEGFFKDAEDALRPYAAAIPAVTAFLVFWALETVTGLLSWIPLLISGGIFELLKIAGIIRVVTETREVKRLTLA